MSAVDRVFKELRAAGKKAFLPFVTAGDPDLEFTAALIRELAARGSSLCEVGIPYSDPIADGPVIQDSYTRALAHKIKVADILATLRTLTPGVKSPLVTMVSYAIIHRYGIDRYIHESQAAGLAGMIVPDLLVEESANLSAICRQADFSLVQLITPTTSRERALRIAESSTGFIYYVSVTGITGERKALPQELIDRLGWLRQQTPLPVCVGFGISGPDQVRQLAPVADGLIVGSAIVRRVAEGLDRPRGEVIREIGAYAATLIEALG
jgi:tryptophan synthase alpha chain